MAKIFISHRREDEGYAARSINDALRNRFGKENVYFDLDSMKPGLDWRVQIDQMVAGCDVMLVIIGDDWLQLDASGKSRLKDEGDLVSFEVSTALKRDIPVIPVLVGNAMIPDKEILPDQVKPLFYRQAVEVRASANFTPQMERLVDSISAVVPEPLAPEPPAPELLTTEPPEPKNRTPTGHLLWVILTLMIIVISWVVWDQFIDVENTIEVVEPEPELPLPEEVKPTPDTTPPILTYSGPSLDIPLPIGPIELVGMVIDDADVTVSVNGKAALVSDDAWTYEVDVTIDTREIRIEASDAAGNKSVLPVFEVLPSPSLFLDTLPPKTVAALWIESPTEFIRSVNRSPFETLFNNAWAELSSEWINTISQNRNLPGIGRAPTFDDLFDSLEDEILVSLGFPKGSQGVPSFLIQASLASDPGKFQRHLDDLVDEVSGGNQLSGSKKSTSSAGHEYVFASKEFRFSIFVKGTNLFASLNSNLAEDAARNFGQHNSDSVTEHMRRLLLERRVQNSTTVMLANVDGSFALLEQLSGDKLSPWANLLGAHGGVVDLGFSMDSDGLYVQVGFPMGVNSSGFLSLLQADPFNPEILPEVPSEADFFASVAGNMEKGTQELMKFFDGINNNPGSSQRELEQLAGPNRSLIPLLAAMGNRAHVYGNPTQETHRDIILGATLNLANQQPIESWLRDQFAEIYVEQTAAVSSNEVWDVTRSRLIFGYDRWVREVGKALKSVQTRPRVELAGLPPEVQAVGYAGSRSIKIFFSDLARSGKLNPQRLGAVRAHSKWTEGRYVIHLEMRWN